MTNAKTTKRALGSSILALVLCFAMLLGTTYAWFTDSVTSANNVIMSGNLDIELEYWDGEEWVDVAGKSDILTNTLWEPGVTEVAYLRVANAGSLALKYQLGINIVSETAGVNAEGNPFLLSDYIQFGVVENVNGETGAYANRDAAVAAATGAKKISAGYTKAEAMTAGQELYLALVVWMPTTVGNVANHNGVNVPKIDLGINVVATQVAYEKDSFDTDYDKDVELPVLNYVTKEEGQAAAIKSGDDADSVVANIPANAPEGEYVLEVANKVVNNTDDGASVSLDISLTLNGEKVSGDTIYAIDIPVGNVYLTTVTHKGVALTQATTGADQTYTFANGVLTIYTKSFSPFTFSYLTGELIAAKAGEQAYALTFDELRTSVNAGNDFSGWTITLMKDINFGGEEFAPIGIATGSSKSVEGCAPFSGLFDGNGHTISNYKVTEGVTVDGDAWMSMFALIYAKDGNTAGVKNLTLSNVLYDNVDATVGIVANLAHSDGASALEFSNLSINGTINAFGYYGQAGIATLMYGSEVLVENVTVDVDFYIPADFTVAGYKFISPCFGQLSMLENSKITFTNVDWSECNFYYPETFKLEDRSTVIAGYNAIWVYNTLAGTRVMGCGGYSGQFYDRGITITIDGVDYTHADLKKDQKDAPGYMYDYIIRPASFTAYTTVTTEDELRTAIQNANDGDVILIANDITVTDNWDERYGGRTSKSITIDGIGHTLKFTNEVHDNNYSCVFRLEGDATVKNLTFDMSEVVKNKAVRMRAISATGNLTVDGCTFIGNATYTTDEAIVVGEGHTANQTPVTVTVTNSTFTGAWRRAISDNESGSREIKSYVISGNTFVDSMVNVSAYESITFTNNEVTNSRVILTSYTNKNNVQINSDN